MGRSVFFRKWFQISVVGLAGSVFAIILYLPGWLNSWESKTWDWRVSLLARPGIATDDIRLIVLDQNSLHWGEEVNGLTWPWPRTVFSYVIDYCRRAGVKALAIDAIFTEPSTYGPDDDKALGDAIRSLKNVGGTIFLSRKSGGVSEWPEAYAPPTPKISHLEQWLDDEQTHPEDIVYPRAFMPITELADSVSVICNVNQQPDKDGVYRRIKLFSIFDGVVIPGLGLGAYLAAHPGATISIEPKRLTVDRRTIPIDAKGEAILKFRGPTGTHRAYSVAAVLQSEIRLRDGLPPTIREPDAFKDKYVFFGFSAAGLYDQRPVAVGGVYTGVEIHATLLDNYLSGDFIRTLPVGVILLIVIGLSLMCAGFSTIFNSPAKIFITSILFLSIPIFSAMVMYQKNYWFPLTVCEIALASTATLAGVVSYATEGRQKRFIKNAFKQYLNPTVIEQLIEHPDQLQLGGQRRMLSIFFSDIQGFTSISEQLEPEALTTFLNEYLTVMTDIIHDEEGTVDKYEGDAIIAFWNAPIDVDNHAERCVRAALRCQTELARLRPEFYDRVGKDVLMRIGINSGEAVVGNLGSRTRFDYTMIGDAVNLAARLEGTNKQFGTYTMVSEFTRNLFGEIFAVRELGRVAVVGRKEPVTVYEPLLWESYEQWKDIFSIFSEGLALFYKGEFSRAVDVFSRISDTDPAAESYLHKCHIMQETNMEDWKGVWVMTQK